MTHTAPGRLLLLSVSDLALLERIRLPVAEGLTVITGETGAGKSLLIDALGLALGARADAGLVRHGAQAARVEALFDRIPEPLIVVRDVTASGRSTARVDDEAVTAGRLAELAAPLVELHGQHEQQRLLDSRRQRALLDAFADAGALVAEARAAFLAILRQGAPLDCVWCGKPILEPDLHVDHVIPFSLWGDNGRPNLMPAHKKENHQKRDKIPSPELIGRCKDRLIRYLNIAGLPPRAPTPPAPTGESQLADAQDPAEAWVRALQEKCRRIIEERGYEPWNP